MRHRQQAVTTTARALAELGLAGRLQDLARPADARRAAAVVAAELLAASLVAARLAQSLLSEEGDARAGGELLRAATTAMRGAVSTVAEAARLEAETAPQLAHELGAVEARAVGVLDPLRDGLSEGGSEG